jgi:hypothetical protein
LMLTFSKEGKLIEISMRVADEAFKRAVAELIRRSGTESVIASEDTEIWRYYYRNQKQDIVGTMTMGRGKVEGQPTWHYVFAFEPLSMPGSKIVSNPIGKSQGTGKRVPTRFPSSYGIGSARIVWGEKLPSVEKKCTKMRKVADLGENGPQFHCPKGNVFVSFNDDAELDAIYEPLTRLNWGKAISEIVEREGTESRTVSKDGTEEWELNYRDANGKVVGSLNVVRTKDANGSAYYLAYWTSKAY